MLKLNQDLARLHECVLRHVQLHDLAVKLSLKHQLHLHRFHRHDRLALLHDMPNCPEDFSDSTRHR